MPCLGHLFSCRWRFSLSQRTLRCNNKKLNHKIRERRNLKKTELTTVLPYSIATAEAAFSILNCHISRPEDGSSFTCFQYLMFLYYKPAVTLEIR